jgi:beta-mannosidase
MQTATQPHPLEGSVRLEGTMRLEAGWALLESIGEDWRWRGLEAEIPRVGGGAFAQPRAIPARVPGNVQHDLLRAGEIADPNVAMNARACEWASARRWVYRTQFTVPKDWTFARTSLEFDGADPGADVFLDGVHVGALEEVGARLSVPLETALGRTHLLVVALREPPNEPGQLGRTSVVRSLKPRMGYWWDFGSRLVPLSLGAVCLRGTGAARLEDVFVRSSWDADGDLAHVTLEGGLEGAVTNANLTVTLEDADGVTCANSIFTVGANFLVALEVPRPRLWQPNGWGEAHLYRCRVGLEVNGSSSDRFETRFGVRRVDLEPNPGASETAEPYTFVVNGQTLFARGWNWVPCDLMTGRANLEPRMRHLLKLARDGGANLIRVNGVGGLESQAFYDLCDELGLMVWQEFPLTSSGLDNVPSDDPAYLQRLEQFAPALIRRVRQHPSLALWGGGNELTDAARKPATLETPAIRVLEAAVRAHDPDRAFRATSPLGPVYDLNDDVALERPDDLHDVHGPWHYRGVTDSLVPFNTSTALFHSEFGAQGASHRRSLERAMVNAWPMDATNPEVVHRGSWWLMAHRVVEAFGEIGTARANTGVGQTDASQPVGARLASPQQHHDTARSAPGLNGFEGHEISRGLETYWRASQLLQAQLVSYGASSNRRRAGRCSGSLLWQLNEPWLNAHNTSAVDHFGRAKMAYRAAQDAHARVAASLRFSSFVMENDCLCVTPFVVADAPWTGELRVSACDLSGHVWREGRVMVQCKGGDGLAGLVTALPALEWAWTQGELCLLRLELLEGMRVVHATETLFSRAAAPVFSGLLTAPRASVRASQCGSILSLEHAAGGVALFVNLDVPEDGVYLRASRDFVCLRPGERLEVHLEVDFLDTPRDTVQIALEGFNLEPSVVEWRVQP